MGITAASAVKVYLIKMHASLILFFKNPVSTTENTQAVNKLVENSAIITSILNVSFVLSITGNLRPFLYALRVHCHT